MKCSHQIVSRVWAGVTDRFLSTFCVLLMLVGDPSVSVTSYFPSHQLYALVPISESMDDSQFHNVSIELGVVRQCMRHPVVLPYKKTHSV